MASNWSESVHKQLNAAKFSRNGFRCTYVYFTGNSFDFVFPRIP